MPENRFPKKDSKGNDITPHITTPITHTEEHKDSTLMKAAKVFFSEDIDHVTDSIVDEFVKPRAMSFGMDLVKKIKEFLFDSITDFAGSIFFGRGPSGNTYNRNGSSYTSYSKYGKGYSNYSSGYNYNSYSEPDNYYYYNGSYYRNDQPKEMVRHDIVRERPIRQAGEAQEVIDTLRTIIKTSNGHFAYVADYYLAIGVKYTDLDPLDFEYIWAGSMLDKCKPRYTKGGYVLDLPKPIPIPAPKL